jgi:Holliday junction resolvasome RuvABC endonuclease subunit
LKVLGVDAATRSGWAIIDTTAGPPRHLGHGIVSGIDASAISDLVEHAAAAGVTIAAVEEPYLDKSAAVAIKLGIIVGRWLQELELAGLKCELFKAQSWQHFALAGLIGPSSPRAQRKAAAKRWVKAEFGLVVPEDAADAIVFATWRAKAARLARLSNAAR